MTLPAGTPTQLYIGGEWRDGSQGTFDVLNPSTGEVIAAVARAGTDDVDAAIDAAAAAQPDWAARAPRERGEVLRKAFELMHERAEDLAFLMSLEMGKSLADARGEVTYAAEFFRWYSEEAVRVGGELRTAPSGANRILTFKKPFGVALLLTPWNFPAAMATRKLGPALAAGCSVVLKPAEDTPLTALVLAQILSDAGAPDGLVNVFTTERPADVVEHALADARVRKLSFTGSTGVGSLLLKQAAGRIVDSSMELGGNDPFLVLDDADLDAAVEGAMLAKMRNGGQACTAANRFLVAESVAEDFGKKLADKMGALTVGAGTDESTQLGPMINAKQRDGIADKVERTVAGRGARGDRWFVTVRDGLLLPGHGAHRRPARFGGRDRRGVRAGRADHHRQGRRGRTGDRERQRDGADGLRLHPRSRSRAAGLRAARGRHDRAQPRSGVRPGGAFRRRQAVRSRSRGRLRGHRGVPRDDLRRHQLVAGRPTRLVVTYSLWWAARG